MNGSCVEPDHCRCHFGFVGRNCSTECRCNRHSECAGVGARDHCLLCRNHTKVGCPGPPTHPRLEPHSEPGGARPQGGGRLWGHCLDSCQTGRPGIADRVSAGLGRRGPWRRTPGGTGKGFLSSTLGAGRARTPPPSARVTGGAQAKAEAKLPQGWDGPNQEPEPLLPSRSAPRGPLLPPHLL